MTIVETHAITGGMDTHLDAHVTAALDPNGGTLGIESFPTPAVGYRELLVWRSSFGAVTRVGRGRHRRLRVGPGAFPSGRGRRRDRGRPPQPPSPNGGRQVRSGRCRRGGRAALSGRARAVAKTATGTVEAIRALVVAKRSGREDRIKALNQIRHLSFTAPDDLRERLRGGPRSAWLRPWGAAAASGR